MIQEWYDKWLAVDTTKGRFLGDILKHSARRSRDVAKRPVAQLCDALAMASVVDRSMVTEMISYWAEVELTGKVTRGQMVRLNTGWGDYEPDSTDANKVDVVVKVDTEVLMSMMMKAVE